jgi:hypothetical protein
VDVQIVFLTSALDGGEWSDLRPGRFTPPGKSLWYPLDRGLSGPQSRSGRCKESNTDFSVSQPMAAIPTELSVFNNTECLLQTCRH